MFVDVFITTCGRQNLFQESLKSFLESTPKNLYRLTIVVDGAIEKGSNVELYKHADHVLWHNTCLGLGPSVNQALSHISNLNSYFDNNKSDFICMCQDDVTYESGWLEKLLKVYFLFSRTHKIGFVSGHNAPEHEKKGEIKFGKDTLYLKPWIRATNMLTTTEYFLSMYPIPPIDPETGRLRGKPNDGLGSGVDWHFIRCDKNSVCKTERINLVYPGLIKHLGYNNSTWLRRELPEDNIK